MTSTRRTLCRVLVLGFLLVATSAGLAGEPDVARPARIKPRHERKIEVPPWETVSESPFGGSRHGGTDERGFALSPDGKLLAGADAGGWRLELWDVETGKSLGRFGRIEDRAALAFAPDGRALVSACAGGSSLSPVDLWEVSTRKRLRQLDEGVNKNPITAAAFSPDGRTLALGAEYNRRGERKSPAIHLWDAASGDEVRALEGLSSPPRPDVYRARHFEALAFSPDGRSLAVVTGDRVILAELGSGKERASVGVLPHVYGLRNWDSPTAAVIAFAPDGRTLGVGTADGVVRLWDVVSGAEFLPFVAHEGAVRVLAFAADGKTLSTFGAGNKLLTWALADASRETLPAGTRRAVDGSGEYGPGGHARRPLGVHRVAGRGDAVAA